MEGFGGSSCCRKGLGMSKSSPSLAAAFSLREYSQQRRKLTLDRPSSQPDLVLEEIDRLGGNGRWRQRKAENYFREKQLEELERLREQRALEEQQRRRRLELEAKRRRQQQEEEQKRQAERDRERREREEREEKQHRREEHDRARKEQEHEEWLARQPRPCGACSGSGLCAACEGKGQRFSLFLVSRVGKSSNMDFGSDMDFGRAPQGCEECGGCRQNILGELHLGSGQCSGCNGRGKVWPKVAFETKAVRPRFKSFGTRDVRDSGDPGSPTSSMGSPKAGGAAAFRLTGFT